MDVIDKATIKWPLVYTMFCTLYLTQKEIKKNPSGVTNMIRFSYTGQEKAWYLFKSRAKEIRAFLHGYGAKSSSWAVNLFLRVLDVRGLAPATQELFKPKNFETVLADVLQAALRMKTNKDYVVQQEQILSKPFISIFLEGGVVHQFELSKTDKAWMKLNNIFKEVL